MESALPNCRYYRALVGQWRGEMDFRITDRKRLRESRLGLTARLCMPCLSMWPSKLFMSTTLDFANGAAGNDFLHTTFVSNLGITLFRSRERIELGDDGHSLQLTGTQVFFPRFWQSEELSAYGSVADDHQRAVYSIPFFGDVMEQSVRVVNEGLELEQVTSFSRAMVHLQRQHLSR